MNITAAIGFFVMVLLSVVKAQDPKIEVCPSREITASRGEIISQAGMLYELGVKCELVIITTPGMAFKVTITDLNILTQQDSRKCTHSALVIAKGDGKNEAICGKRSKYAEPQTFTTVSNKLVLRYYTINRRLGVDGDRQGFELSFSVVKKAPISGMSICPSRHIKKKRSGTIFSPGFPGNYGNNQNCKIEIPIPDNWQLNVWFSHFSLQRSSRCQSDKLSIRDEHGGVKICGRGRNRFPSIKHYTGSLAKFHFKTDASLVSTGFRLDYNMTRLTEGRCMCSTGSSYMCISNFNRKVRRVWHRIKFSVKTSRQSGLILYSHKGSYKDYMYVAIQGGKVYYKSDLGTGPSMAVSHGLSINDGKWHYVEIRRKRRSLTIAVDNGKAVGSAKTKGSFARIDLENSLGYVLGTPPQLRGMPNFIGCIRDFTIDGREPLTNAFVKKPDYHGHYIKGMQKC